MYYQSKGLQFTDEEMAKENKAIYAKLARPLPKQISLLVDIRPVNTLSRDARLVYLSCAPMFSAVALLVKSPLSRIIGSFVLGMKKKESPIRMFNCPEKALDWLSKYN